MPQEWKPILDLANNVTVVAVVIYGAYLLVAGKLHTAKHTEDVVKAMQEGHAAEVRALEARNADLLGERDRAVARTEAVRRELAENTAVLARYNDTLRELAQRRR